MPDALTRIGSTGPGAASNRLSNQRRDKLGDPIVNVKQSRAVRRMVSQMKTAAETERKKGRVGRSICPLELLGNKAVKLSIVLPLVLRNRPQNFKSANPGR